jgi:hypothetical protein
MNFAKKADNTSTSRHDVYYSDERAVPTEVKSAEIMTAPEPSNSTTTTNEIFLVRDDGRCFYPSGFIYP